MVRLSRKNMLQNLPVTVWVIAGLFVICVLFFYELLFSGEIVNATDILTQQYFWNVFIKENLFEDPCFRTWLPYINAGTPFSGGLDILFRPVTFLTLLLLPVHIAINYEMVLYCFLLGAFMYFYMRELEVSPPGAFLAALILMLNGEIVSLLNAGHVNKIGAIFPIPLVFWMFERALRRKTLSAFMIAAVALGFQFWQGHVQISFYTCIAVGIYYVIRAGILYKQGKNVAYLVKLTTFALLMVIVFLLLSAVNFLPLLSFAEVSDRSEGVDYEFATSWSMPPEELVTYLVPGFFGLRRANHFEDEPQVLQVPYWGRMPFTQTGRYFGLLPLLFVFLALCFVRNKHVLTLSIIAFVILLLGMGRYIPTYKLLYEYVPGFNMFRAPQMILFLFAFATAALAGFGVEWLLSNFTEQKDKRLRIFLLVCVGLFLLFWLITIVLPQLKPTLLSHFHEAFFRKGATPEIAEARFLNIFRGFLQFNVFFGIALFILGLRLVKHIRIWGLVSAILVMFLVDIWLFDEKYIDTIPLENSLYVSENDAIRYCKANPGTYRILPMTNSPDTYATFNKYVYHHLYSVSGYEAVGVQYYNDYLQHMALGTQLVDLLNIKYIILPKDVQFGEEPQQIEVGQIVGPYKVVLNADAVLLENLNVLPRVFPVHNAYVMKTREEILSALQHPEFNPGEFVILEEQPNVTMSPENVPSSQSKAQITYYMNRTIQIQASMATDGFLVLSEKYYPGWKAYIDGTPTKIYKADYTLQAIVVPKGEHEITFVFQPADFLLGFGITIITCLGLLIAVLYRKTPLGRLMKRFTTNSGRACQKWRPVHCSKQFLWGILGCGILLHTVQYLFNRSLHVDEAALALNIINRSFSGFFQPLDYGQAAPVGFLMIEKLLVHLFGTSEYVLRVFPFLSMLIAIVLFWRITLRWVSPTTVPIALGLFVLSEPLLYFSSTLKQHGIDVFWALLIYTLLNPFFSQKVRTSHIALCGLVGALAIWCSHTAVLVLAGVGTTLGIYALVRKDWPKLIRLCVIYCLWGAFFLMTYMVSLHNVTQDEHLLTLAAREFMPLPLSWKTITWILQALLEFVGFTTGLSQAIFDRIQSHSMSILLGMIPRFFKSMDGSASQEGMRLLLFSVLWGILYLVAIFFWIIGGIRLFSHNKKIFFLLVSPLLFAFLATGLQKFPFSSRLRLFFIPTVILFIAEGVIWVRNHTQQRYPVLGVMLIVALLWYPIWSGGCHLFRPRTDQETKPMFRYVQDRKQPGDIFYVYYGAENAFKYYAQRFDFDDDTYIIGVWSREDWNNYISDLGQLMGKARVWLLFSHMIKTEEAFFLAYLESKGGRQLDSFQGIKAAAYLYDLSDW